MPWLLASYNVFIFRYLQHYVEFDIRTTIMLEQLFGVGFFGDFISHLTCHLIIFHVSSGGFGLISVI
jgi:hypothetical protein